MFKAGLCTVVLPCERDLENLVASDIGSQSRE